MSSTPSGAGRRVRQLREGASLTTRELDALAGLTPGHVSQLENTSGARVSARTIVDIARVFGATAEWILDGKGRAPSARVIANAIGVARARRSA